MLALVSGAGEHPEHADEGRLVDLGREVVERRHVAEHRDRADLVSTGEDEPLVLGEDVARLLEGVQRKQERDLGPEGMRVEFELR